MGAEKAREPQLSAFNRRYGIVRLLSTAIVRKRETRGKCGKSRLTTKVGNICSNPEGGPRQEKSGHA